ncbi:MAG TPA: DUF433 domain-containing protein [Actinomycetota bacterium]|nr:DUF433 domain-containing protein [Actinomycetota bacterium]
MTDPRFDLALYPVPEAARLARVPARTVANWIRGYRYVAQGKQVEASPVVRPTVPGEGALSFVNLVEVGTLAGFRRAGVSMQKIRRGLEYVAREMNVSHPLASQRILTDGVELFWEYQEKEGEDLQVVNVTRGGQKVFPEVVMRYLRSVEWGPDSFATRWWPGAPAPGQGAIVVDPRRAFGAPVLAGTGIRVEDVFLRFSAGESLRELAEDYGLSLEQVEAAIRAEARFLEPVAA